MVSVPIVRRFSEKKAEALSKRLFWGIPVRLAFEFYFILALCSWNNMNNPSADISVYASYIVLICLFTFTAYLYYVMALVHNINEDDAIAKKNKIKQLLVFIQRPLRLRRNKPIKFIQPVFYFTRRMLLAITCVYLSQNYAYQWVIWTLLSLGQLFILAKIRPFGDFFMNIV